MAGPLMAVARTVTGEVQRQATDALRQHFREPAPVPNGKPSASRQNTNSTRNGTPTVERQLSFSDMKEM
ncbi:hypothetical protein FRC11_009321 [Ceratobasidium sp. 423]|nr:hypothetical protein FRC11_009321 [Ceratobasidium sp. 423]